MLVVLVLIHLYRLYVTQVDLGARSDCYSNVTDLIETVFFCLFVFFLLFSLICLFTCHFARFGCFACFGRFAHFGGFVSAVLLSCFGFKYMPICAAFYSLFEP